MLKARLYLISVGRKGVVIIIIIKKGRKIYILLVKIIFTVTLFTLRTRGIISFDHVNFAGPMHTAIAAPKYYPCFCAGKENIDRSSKLITLWSSLSA